VSDEVRERIEKLLRRGLNHYGLGDVDGAIGDWEQARKLDPENCAVRDYLESAYAELGRKPPSESLPQAEPPTGVENAGEESRPGLPESPTLPLEDSDDLVGKALVQFRGGQLTEARARLERAAKLEPDRLDIQGYLELVRSQLLRQYEKSVGDQGRPVKVGVSPSALKTLSLTPVEGYLLSQIDGHVTIEELLSLSTVDRFQTLEILSRLLREGIINS
jgi:tetratricopeptide (TPR) repeat protein